MARKEGGNPDQIIIDSLDYSLSEKLRTSTLELIKERGVKNKKYSFFIFGIKTTQYSDAVEIKYEGKIKRVNLFAFTTGSDDAIIDLGQMKDGCRVRLALYDWRGPLFIYPDRTGFTRLGQSPTGKDMDFYSKVIETASNKH